jgi:allophanate hydrolase subunit 2
VLGPQDDYFTADSTAAFFASEYRVTREADRMGMRLDGPVLAHAKGHDIVSDGIATGAIQVPGNGRPIVLLADHQTTGGYPKLGTVVSADVPRLGRLRPGDALRFARVEVEEAEAARRVLEERIDRIVERFGPAEPWLDEDALYRRNLVSGIVEPG